MLLGDTASARVPVVPAESGEDCSRNVIDVILVIESPVIAAGVRSLLDAVPDVRVIGEGGASDLRCIHRNSVIVVGAVLARDASPGLSGQFDGWDGEVLSRTVLLASAQHAEWLATAIRAGVRSIVTPDGPIDELVQAVRAVHAGSALLAQSIVRPVLDRLTAVSEDDGINRLMGSLTVREREVLRAMVDGVSNQGIAQMLTVSVRTVKFHVSNILAKLQVEGRAQLMALVVGGGRVAAAIPAPPNSRNPRPRGSVVGCGPS